MLGAILLSGDDVAVQDQFFGQQLVSCRCEVHVILVREGAELACFVGDGVVR